MGRLTYSGPSSLTMYPVVNWHSATQGKTPLIKHYLKKFYSKDVINFQTPISYILKYQKEVNTK